MMDGEGSVRDQAAKQRKNSALGYLKEYQSPAGAKDQNQDKFVSIALRDSIPSAGAGYCLSYTAV